MAITDIEGVFNFQQHFPGPHMIRVKLYKDQVSKILRQLATMLEADKDSVEFSWFGTLRRDAEEDKGNEILVEE